MDLAFSDDLEDKCDSSPVFAASPSKRLRCNIGDVAESPAGTFHVMTPKQKGVYKSSSDLSFAGKHVNTYISLSAVNDDAFIVTLLPYHSHGIS